MATPQNIPFGAADITIGGTSDVDKVVFDGINHFQADGGEVSLEPILADIKVIDFGDVNFDDRINGYEGTVKIVATSNDIKIIKVALGHATVKTDATTSKDVITDSAVGTSLRAKGKPITIHPREMGADKSLDINIYLATSAGAFERSYNAEQGTQEIELKMYPKNGADASKEGNYFYIGEKDPNVVTP